MENLVTSAALFSFYKNKRVFVTGHTGFKGSWLTCVLQRAGAIVKGYSLAPEQSGGLFDFVLPQFHGENIIDDVRNKEQLTREVQTFQPDFVFHLAAQPLVRRSYEQPAETFDINVTGTANLLEAVRGLKNRCATVVITTDKVYHNKEQDILYKEEDQLGGYDPYSASKACCELVCDSFRKSFFNTANFADHQKSLATARAGNVIGGGDWSKDRLVPDIVSALMSDRTLEIRYPASVRPWQHVLEAVAGYLHLGYHLASDPQNFSRAFNFGPFPDDHLTVKEVVEFAIEYIGKGNWMDKSDAQKPHEAGLLKLDIGLATRMMNWQPKLNAREAITWTLEWYKQSDEKKLQFTLGQVDAYFEL